MNSESASLARPPVALVVSEHEWSTLSLESVLGPNGYAVLRAFNAKQALDRVRSIGPDVVFIDAKLPDMDGVQLCRALRQHASISLAAPIVIISSEHVTREQQVGALRAGAWEYVRLPVDAEQLLLRLESYLKAKFEADRARDESLLDVTTGLYSMRGLLRRARELVSEAARYHRPLACVVIAPEMDADPAQSELGESVLAELTELFRATNRTSDAIGRLGPSEFVLLAPETDAEGARGLAERLREVIDRANAARGSSPIRIRVGCYAIDDAGEAGIEPVEMLTRATLALRHSQSERSGNIAFYGNAAPPKLN